MIFVKGSLITITTVVIAIWAIPADTSNETFLQGVF